MRRMNTVMVPTYSPTKLITPRRASDVHVLDSLAASVFDQSHENNSCHWLSPWSGRCRPLITNEPFDNSESRLPNHQNCPLRLEDRLRPSAPTALLSRSVREWHASVWPRFQNHIVVQVIVGSRPLLLHSGSPRTWHKNLEFAIVPSLTLTYASVAASVSPVWIS